MPQFRCSVFEMVTNSVSVFWIVSWMFQFNKACFSLLDLLVWTPVRSLVSCLISSFHIARLRVECRIHCNGPDFTDYLCHIKLSWCYVYMYPPTCTLKDWRCVRSSNIFTYLGFCFFKCLFVFFVVQMGIEVKLSKLNLTKIITITPFYMLHNLTQVFWSWS